MRATWAQRDGRIAAASAATQQDRTRCSAAPSEVRASSANGLRAVSVASGRDGSDPLLLLPSTQRPSTSASQHIGILEGAVPVSALGVEARKVMVMDGAAFTLATGCTADGRVGGCGVARERLPQAGDDAKQENHGTGPVARAAQTAWPPGSRAGRR
jgi:hypothetical protein